MTVIDSDYQSARIFVRPARGRAPQRIDRRRPGAIRPSAGAVAYHGTGVAMSRAQRGGPGAGCAGRRRPVGAAMTVALAGMAALITIWLGAIAHSGGVSETPTAIPQQLAVVRVQAGESLQQLAARVAPDAPVSQVVERIRELNKLESAALDAGQTLIAPVGPGADHAG